MIIHHFSPVVVSEKVFNIFDNSSIPLYVKIDYTESLKELLTKLQAQEIPGMGSAVRFKLRPFVNTHFSAV